jgi:hypothetical protein
MSGPALQALRKTGGKKIRELSEGLRKVAVCAGGATDRNRSLSTRRAGNPYRRRHRSRSCG